jgi:hypothetical protein
MSVFHTPIAEPRLARFEAEGPQVLESWGRVSQLGYVSTIAILALRNPQVKLAICCFNSVTLSATEF